MSYETHDFHDEDDQTISVPIPDVWTPEQAQAAIDLIEAVLDALHRRYDLDIFEYHSRRGPNDDSS